MNVILMSSSASALEAALQRAAGPDGYHTVEAEYGDVLVGVPAGCLALAHHGPRAWWAYNGNFMAPEPSHFASRQEAEAWAEELGAEWLAERTPAPCLMDNVRWGRNGVPIDRWLWLYSCDESEAAGGGPDVPIGLSHFDLDTLGGILAIQGVKPDAPGFWRLAAFADVHGGHRIAEAGASPEDVDRINAWYACSEQHRAPRLPMLRPGQDPADPSLVLDVTEYVEQMAGLLRDILRPDDATLIMQGWQQYEWRSVYYGSHSEYGEHDESARYLFRPGLDMSRWADARFGHGHGPNAKSESRMAWDEWFDALTEGVDYIEADEPSPWLERGRAWFARLEQVSRDTFVERRGPVAIRVGAPFTNGLYRCPDGTTVEGIASYNTASGAVTISIANSEEHPEVNCREIVQRLWGPEAGGHAGIAGGPRGRRMTLRDLDDAASALAAVLGDQSHLAVRITVGEAEMAQDWGSTSCDDDSSPGSGWEDGGQYWPLYEGLSGRIERLIPPA